MQLRHRHIIEINLAFFIHNPHPVLYHECNPTTRKITQRLAPPGLRAGDFTNPPWKSEAGSPIR